MAYVNERMSKEDWKECERIVAARRRYGGGANRHWAIDRERKIWFKAYQIWTSREDGSEMFTEWDFYWKGIYVPAETMPVERTLSDEGESYGLLRLSKIEIPKNALQHKSEILKELKAALEASFMGLGIYAYGSSDLKSCKVDLEYEGALV
ncbi:MAG: hypothetical protein LBO72_09735 [Helicobacteraceae bacterium]|jgi:hypothetical protein|nr:hypothetical protein [Helicobacteraceae bacterium]